MQQERYRVAQWATGHTGMHSLRKIIEHPHYDLVGLYVYSDAKAGQDAGGLCGSEPTGVIATREIEDIVAARPDCVLYMPMLDHESIDDMCRLLESGANIVTMYVTKDLDPAWDVRDTGWHVVVEGDAPLDVEAHFARENYGSISPGYNAHIAVNAVPAVCDAPPGIRTTDELRLVACFG